MRTSPEAFSLQPMRHSFLYRGQHIAVEMSTRDEVVSWRFALNGGAYRRSERMPHPALPAANALAAVCAAARGAVDLGQSTAGSTATNVDCTLSCQ